MSGWRHTLANSKLIEFCRELIRIPSPSGRERLVAELIQRKMKTYDFDEIQIDAYGSVVGLIKGRFPGRTVLMDGHIDHVPVTDAQEWTYPPFDATLEEGKIFGRASSDMKGGIAAMITAAADFAKETDRNFAGTVAVSCSVHEERFEGIASREISKAIQPDFVIIGEATSGTIKIGQRGRAEVHVETEGLSCHSSSPEKGVNAVYLMTHVIEEIRQIQEKEHPILGKGIWVLTDIISSPYPGASVVPALCRATFDRRILVGETEASILAEVNAAIDRAKATVPGLEARATYSRGEELCWTGKLIRAERFFPAWLLDEDSEIIQKARRGLSRMGIDAPISHFSFCTNGSHFCGEAGIPTIGYGPSLEKLAHIRDEYIEITELENAYAGYKGILSELLSERGSD